MRTRIHLHTDINGAAAVEFALLASLMIMTLMFILSVGAIMFMGQRLDAAAARAARQIMVGNVQNAGTSQNDFQTNFVCANLPNMFDCSKLIVNLQTVTKGAQPGGYYALVNSNQTALIVPAAGNAQYSPGSQQSYEYLQLVYPVTFLPTSIAALLGGGTTYNGSKAVMLVSTTAFRNEQY